MVSKVIVVGSGAREYAIIKKIRKDYNKLSVSTKLEIICLMTNKNSMIHQYCDEIYDINVVNPSYIIEKIVNETKVLSNCNILFSIVGPENYLETGIAEIFERFNIKCIGPYSNYAKIETSKSFCRNFLRDNGFNSRSLKWLTNYACRGDYRSLSNQVSAWGGIHYFACRH